MQALKKKGTLSILPAKKGLVPPPPPYTPSIYEEAYQPSIIPTSGARQDFGYNMVNVPTVDPQMSDYLKPDQGALSGLQNAIGTQRSALSDAQDRLNNTMFMSVPSEISTDRFTKETFLPSLQASIADHLTRRNSAGSRFGRGFDIGQNIAANTLVPLVGLFGGAGNAIGAYEATRALRQNVAQNQMRRAQEESTLNQAMTNLASLYENISPQSAKNIDLLLRRQIDTSKLNSDMQQSAQKDILSLSKDIANSEDKLAQLQQTQKRDYAEARHKSIFDQLQAGQLQQSLNNFASQDANRQANTLLRGQELTQRNQQFDQQQTLRQQEVREKALVNLERFLRLNATNAMAQSGSDYKFKGFADYFAKNPATRRIYQQYAEAAGLGDLNPDVVFKAFSTQEPGQEQDSGNLLDAFLSMGAKAVDQGSKNIVDRGWKNILGFAPGSSNAQKLDFENVAKSPFQYISVGKREQQLLKAGDLPSLASSVRTRLTQLLGTNPSSQQIADVLNQMEKQHADNR